MFTGDAALARPEIELPLAEAHARIAFAMNDPATGDA
jgi:hypothetical protein